MKPSYLSPIAAVAALTLFAGCSDGGSQSAGEPLPAPSRSTEAAGNTVPSPQAEEEADSAEQVEQSEFAALDTNSNGMLEEREWESEQTSELAGLKNMTFAQLDRNDSGGIEPDEFRKARSGGDEASQAENPADAAIGESGVESNPVGP